MHQQAGTTKTVISVLVIATVLIFGVEFFWSYFLVPNTGAELGTMGWYLFSFVSGLTLIVLPCTLPLAFVVVPLVMKRGVMKGLGMVLSFGAGVILMLSLYGIVVAMLGKEGLGLLDVDGEDIKNWVYFFAGIFAYLFALGEIGLLKFHMPSYTGSAPDFIQKGKNHAKAFFLGMFLGNIGIGCPHPATPLILVEVASSGNVFYGWSLFLAHALGRVVPLLFLTLLAGMGINSLNWLVARKSDIERASGWAMVFVSGFVLTFGLFTPYWWINSGQYDLLQMVTWGDVSLSSSVEQAGVGIFGQPLVWGNWFIVLIWVIPLWWYYCREKKRVLDTPALQIKHLEMSIAQLETERRNFEVMLHLPEGKMGERLREIEAKLDLLEKERKIFEEGLRYRVASGLRDAKDQAYEEQVLRLRRNWYAMVTILLFVIFSVLLPFWFATAGSSKSGAYPVSEEMFNVMPF